MFPVISLPALPGILVDLPKSGGTCIAGKLFLCTPCGSDAVGALGFTFGKDDIAGGLVGAGGGDIF